MTTLRTPSYRTTRRETELLLQKTNSFTIWINGGDMHYFFTNVHMWPSSSHMPDKDIYVPVTVELPMTVAPREGFEDGLVKTIQEYLNLFHEDYTEAPYPYAACRLQQYSIVRRDNFDRDYYLDQLIATNIAESRSAKIMCDALNADNGESGPYHYDVIDHEIYVPVTDLEGEIHWSFHNYVIVEGDSL